MPNNHEPLAVLFRRNDGLRERIRLPNGTLADAVVAIQRVFHISDGLYTRAEIFCDDELVETVENPCSVHVASILIQ